MPDDIGPDGRYTGTVEPNGIPTNAGSGLTEVDSDGDGLKIKLT